MDFIVEILKQGLPFFLFTIALAFIAKSYLIAQMKRWDLAELFFSFFRIYNSDEVRMSSNKKRIAFMRWNNLLNYYVYIMSALIALIYIVTKNVN